MWHFLLHWLGMDNASGPAYLAWSGWASDLGELTIAAALVGMLRKHNCEVHRCWRLGRHPTAAGQHVCRLHHPDGPLTVEGIRAAHHLYLGSKPGKG
jgi:hypothetical protein